MRNRTLPFAFLALALLTFIPGCDDVRYELQLTLDKWIEADRSRNGAAYLAVLDPESIEHYDQLLVMVRSGTREQIRRLPPSSRLMVTHMRVMLTGAELRKLDARGLIAASVSQWEEPGRRSYVTLGQIKHKSPRAQAQLVVNGEWTRQWVEFVKIEDTWRVSDRAFYRWLDERIEERARRINRSEDYVVLSLVRDLTGKRFDDRIWDSPPR